MIKRGLAPEGWHIPANADWMTLVKNLKGVDIAGTKLKSATGWKSKKGTNDIGFSLSLADTAIRRGSLRIWRKRASGGQIPCLLR